MDVTFAILVLVWKVVLWLIGSELSPIYEIVGNIWYSCRVFDFEYDSDINKGEYLNALKLF